MRLDSTTPYRDLSSRLAQSVAIQRLHELQQLHPTNPLRTFATWEDARCWLESVGHREPETDAVVRPVLEAAKAAPDELWHEIALFLFWRPLVICRRGMKRYDKEKATLADLPDARLDSEILWAFITILHRIDLVARSDRLGMKILNDVQHDVRKAYKPEGHPPIVSDDDNAATGLHDRENRKPGRKRVVQFLYLLIDGEEEEDEEGRGVRAPGIEDEEFVAVERRHDGEWARAHLKALVRRGEISGPDYLILIGCILYRRPIEEMAARLGMSYDAARKRQQRVLKYLRENAKKMSHTTGRKALTGVEGRKPGRRNHD